MNAKNHIQAVAIDLFSEKGFHSTSIRDIAIAAQVNSSMLSYYFHSKENLYVSLFESFKQAYLSEFDMQTQEIASEIDFQAFLDKTICFSVTNRKMLLLIFSERIFQTSLAINEIIASILNHHFNLFSKIYTNAKKIEDNDNEIVKWQYFTFFFNLKNVLIGVSGEEDSPAMNSYISPKKFIEKSAERIFNIKYEVAAV